ncbi:hypothetical protein ACIPY6_28770 [Streptomyces sp. NPDC090054]|uniref:hypothetical protein n=1 Tax=Streptomyces sp. NPDC090054 TaxID=3365933 RepID=UPI003816A1DF
MTGIRNALPEEELTRQADEGEPEKGRWSQQELLLATISDAVRKLEHTLISLNVEKKDRPAPPEPMRRPGATAPKAKDGLTDENAQTLFQLINGGAA